jgi:hypothetical protein
MAAGLAREPATSAKLRVARQRAGRCLSSYASTANTAAAVIRVSRNQQVTRLVCLRRWRFIL